MSSHNSWYAASRQRLHSPELRFDTEATTTSTKANASKVLRPEYSRPQLKPPPLFSVAPKRNVDSTLRQEDPGTVRTARVALQHPQPRKRVKLKSIEKGIADEAQKVTPPGRMLKETHRSFGDGPTPPPKMSSCSSSISVDDFADNLGKHLPTTQKLERMQAYFGKGPTPPPKNNAPSTSSTSSTGEVVRCPGPAKGKALTVNRLRGRRSMRPTIVNGKAILVEVKVPKAAHKPSRMLRRMPKATPHELNPHRGARRHGPAPHEQPLECIGRYPSRNGQDVMPGTTWADKVKAAALPKKPTAAKLRFSDEDESEDEVTRDARRSYENAVRRQRTGEMKERRAQRRAQERAQLPLQRELEERRQMKARERVSCIAACNVM